AHPLPRSRLASSLVGRNRSLRGREVRSRAAQTGPLIVVHSAHPPWSPLVRSMRAHGRNASPWSIAEHAYPVLLAEHGAWGAECSTPLSLPALQLEVAAQPAALVGTDLRGRSQERWQAGALFVPPKAAQRKTREGRRAPRRRRDTSWLSPSYLYSGQPQGVRRDSRHSAERIRNDRRRETERGQPIN